MWNFKVMRCTEPQGQAFALKVLHPPERFGYHRSHQEIKDEFIYEGQFQATLNHENIVKVTQFGTVAGCQQVWTETFFHTIFV
jgi:hypothetical protein